MNKQLQQRIGELLGKDYFKLEFGCEIKVVDYSGFGLLGKDSQNRELIEGFNGYATLINYFVDYSPRDSDGSPDRDDIVHFEILVEGVYLHLEDVLCEDYIEILGTEPTLQDVLLAIDDKNYCIDCRGNFGKTLYVDSGLPVMKYDLTKSLFNQTDEVKRQLLELMS